MQPPVRLAALAALLTLSVVRLPAQTSEGPMLKPEEFVILPWSWAKEDPGYMQSIRDCGMNMAGVADVKYLDAVRAAGLKCLVWDREVHASDRACKLSQEEIDKRIAALAARVKGRPEVFGVYLRDEPSAAVFSGLARWSAAVKREMPGLIPYINLFPNYASPDQLGAATYDEYLAKFVETTRSPFISYDHYALMDDGTLRDGYFQNLESARKASLASGIPFWNIVLANSHFHYAEPSLGGLQFQAYTTLAYGARGLSYFTYTAPEVGNYRLAPIDQFGNKTPTWDLLRNVNNQIHRIGPTYIKLKSVNVFHHPTVPKNCSAIDKSKHVAELTGGEFVVGEFEDAQGTPYVLVVNKDLHRSTAFSVKFKQQGAVTQVNCFTGAHNAWGGENNWLAPGQGMLLYVKKP